jgi:DNA polymerase III subunit gamma/tau
MAFDTKYRPRTYDDVLGQDAAVSVLRQFLKEGRGYSQSYVFCGAHGSGKTTLGRILARALLCPNTKDNGGDPCNECHSCKTLLAGKTHESFQEHDAASKSGKADLSKVIEDISYATFSGNRRIYLFDESHRLSKQALDVLLKPMEDDIEGTEEKQLVCIFCTTEPEKMSSTIFSRCAPAFVIRMVSPENIGKRLAWVCDQEGVEYDPEVLPMIAEIEECHIRDALKTLEGVSLLGPVTRESVTSYLHLGANDLVLDLLDALGKDLKRAVEIAMELGHEISPSAAYGKLAEAALCAFRAHLGVGKIPSQWNAARIEKLSERGPELLGISSAFAVPPHRPTRHSLVLDVGISHYPSLFQVSPSKACPEASFIGKGSPPEPSPDSEGKVFLEKPEKPDPPKSVVDEPARDQGGVWVDPKAIGRGPGTLQDSDSSEKGPSTLSPSMFRELVRHHLRGMLNVRRRQG